MLAYSGGTAQALHLLPCPSSVSVVRGRRSPAAARLEGGQYSTLEFSGFPVQTRITAAGLGEIDEKLRARERLTFEDGLRLFDGAIPSEKLA